MFAEARLTNLIANLLALLAVLSIVVGAVVWTIRRPYFSISRIELAPVAGSVLQYVTPLSLQTALAGQVGGNFLIRVESHGVLQVRQCRFRVPLPVQHPAHTVHNGRVVGDQRQSFANQLFRLL